MLDFLLGLVNGIVGFLNGVLPNSPLSGFVTGVDTLRMGLGWLNWFFPVGDCLILFGAWVALLLAYTAVQFFLSKGLSIMEKVV